MEMPAMVGKDGAMRQPSFPGGSTSTVKLREMHWQLQKERGAATEATVAVWQCGLVAVWLVGLGGLCGLVACVAW